MVNSIQYFNVEGTIIINKEKIQFSKAVRAVSEQEAERMILLHYGSKHKVKRQLIKINSVKAIKADQVDDPIGREFAKADSFKFIKG